MVVQVKNSKHGESERRGTDKQYFGDKIGKILVGDRV